MWTEEIILTPHGGRFYRAIAFHIFANILLIFFFVPLFVFIYILPSKYRKIYSNKIDQLSEKASYLRDFYKYWIYLNCNPDVWHILKDAYIERGD